MKRPLLLAMSLAMIALMAPPARAHMEDGLVIPGISTGDAVQSYLRFSNSDGAAHSASVMLHDAGTGEMLATWTSPSIPVGGTLEATIGEILAGSTPRLSGTTVPASLVGVITGLTGHVQHATWVATSRAWSNVTTCGMMMMADPLSLPYVSGPARTGLAGFIRITNGTTHARTLQLTFTDNAGRASVWRSPSVPALGSIVTAVAEIAVRAAPAITTTAKSLSVMSESAPAGFAISYIEGASGGATFDDFSAACMLSAESPTEPDSHTAIPPSSPAGQSDSSMNTDMDMLMYMNMGMGMYMEGMTSAFENLGNSAVIAPLTEQ